MSYIEINCCKGKTFRIRATKLIHKARSAHQDIAIYDTEEFGRCLFLDDVIQCSEKDHEIYDRALLKQLRPTDGRLLILGGGDGYTAEIALKRNPNLEITVVDLDAGVVDACRRYLDQKVFEDPRIKLVTADAFHFMKQAGIGKYDGVVCDLTDFPVGYSDGSFREFYASVFPLSKAVLNDGGWLGVYAGSRDAVINGGMPIASALEEMLSGLFAGTKKEEALIPSYGEPVCFLYGLMANTDSAAWVYTPFEEAKTEIWKRWNDERLRREVAGFVGDIPEPLRNEPRAILDRNVMSPDIEFLQFFESAQKIGLQPLGLEYVNDKFCSVNKDKFGLASMTFYCGKNRKNENIIARRNIIDFHEFDGKRFNEIKTLWGESFVDCHHRLLYGIAPKIDIFDLSMWYEKHGGHARAYYEYFLSLFVRNGVLFENFLMDEKEHDFTIEVVLSAFESAQKRFGVKPLIVPIAPPEEATDTYWWCYPDIIKKELEKHG